MSSILVVDDCRDIAAILERHLRSAGHTVTLAHDGITARVLVARSAPDCVFLDLMMPVMTGMELLHELKSDPATAKIPIVLVSARVGEGRTHIGSEHDADYSVGKPFTRRQVLDAVAAVLPNTPRAPQRFVGSRAFASDHEAFSRLR
jgi:two-component system alkaline phosphatase synthesis response regulator PhoP